MKKETGLNKNLDPWIKLKQFTSARIGIGRSGVAVPTAELLAFQMAHAQARDAVLTKINFDKITSFLKKEKLSYLELESACHSREIYLTRPDLGRVLSENSKARIKTNSKVKNKISNSISLIIVDGLSSAAIEKNIISLFKILLPELHKRKFRIAPIALVENGRVAVGDEISFLQKTDICLVLIGERPGLSSPDSLGVYLTYKTKPKTTDERRNCISNIREGGMNYPLATTKILYLIEESLRKKISGVNLKDNAIDSGEFEKITTDEHR
ncbi:MAG TPA: ethanolamine ammonia-lyase subunit EutC [Leptospiraceae bacterium]|nr:ethanolamine ammonia-lyase subunit EutC [Leptospiraceae bacterium]HRG75993.1 ethanolamine ammonia-lyase subunit EutC [Leptospiraceae bacterium]